MKPIAVFNGSALVSVVTAIILWYLVVDLFEHRIGTPVVSRRGEEPFAYDADVMPFVPCCGLILYLLIANTVFVVLLRKLEPFKVTWWIIAGFIFLAPFGIPVMVALTAILFPNQSEPIIIWPDDT